MPNWIAFGVGCILLIIGFTKAPEWARYILLGFFYTNVLSKLKW